MSRKRQLELDSLVLEHEKLVHENPAIASDREGKYMNAVMYHRDPHWGWSKTKACRKAGIHPDTFDS
jgi:hypothetical protein